jgi:A/G-specific adenine glycosylase
MNPEAFSARLLAWFAEHGRRDLPWQSPVTPYRVWVSEIMLQQTQVNTVIPYFQRFMTHFPDISALAEAELDEVLGHWSGLGYYARARNLHRAARLVQAEHHGQLPSSLEKLTALPGIGRSTAGAILSLAFAQRQPILDGNVRRVLCRYHAIPGWPGERAVEQTLWRLAEQHTPVNQCADYTQAIMDLGATVCRRSQPRCAVCPQQGECRAGRTGKIADYPAPRPRKALPVKQATFLIVRAPGGQVLLQKRPLRGIWGGLWSFPECPPEIDIRAWGRAHLGLDIGDWQAWPAFRHTFTHFHLDITPLYIPLEQTPVLENRVAEDTFWYDTPQPGGLPAPVAHLLKKLERMKI